jgi:hypothetical protein
MHITYSEYFVAYNLCYNRFITYASITIKKLEKNVSYTFFTYLFMHDFTQSTLFDIDHQRHPHSEHNLVRMNDVVFTLHGFFISLFILLQSCVYKVKYQNYFEKLKLIFRCDRNMKLNKYHLLLHPLYG